MKTVRRMLLWLLGAGCVAGAGVALLYLPHENLGEVYVTFERGAGTRAMARALADAGVIRWPWEFMLLRASHPSAPLVAGEYRFSGPATPWDVFARIRRGDIYFYELTVPEGSNMFDIAALLDSAGVLSGADFLSAASDPAPIRDLAPSAPSQEGYLFPATYRLPHSITARGLCDLMTGQFRRQWKKLADGSAAAATSPQEDAHSIVTLASLVEKETAVAQERPLVAGVFANRIRAHMRLDCDPTSIYAALLEHRYQGAIHRSDLDSQNPYNTYQHEGLPPGPIGNPGREALSAALHPSSTEYLYFVAKPGGGTHQFSATLAAHERAVRDYRHGTQDQIAAKGAGKTR